MTVPWKRGDGHFTVTVSLPLILVPIVKSMRRRRVLSTRIAEFLWATEGIEDLEGQEGEMLALMAEKALIDHQIKQKEEEVLLKLELAQKAERLKEIRGDLDNHRRLRNAIKNNPGGRWTLKSYALQSSEIVRGQEIVTRFGGEEAFLAEWEKWMEEKESLVQEIAHFQLTN